MTTVMLTGFLLCRDRAESELVATLLPAHVSLTRAEAGCRSFDVEATDNALVWSVSERFSDATSFRAHQARVASSEWGKATASMERRYVISGLDEV
jgi:quinol monooxygenase YgiN